jgi:DNA-binding transcriptional ArsR family regulator
MARKKSRGKRTRNTVIKLEPDRNILNVLLKPRVALVRSPIIHQLVRESNMQRNLEPHAKQIMLLRQILNPEKIKMLYIIKHEKPSSIYDLAKTLNRDFKTVRQDLKVLEQTGFVKIVKENVKNRVCSKPLLILDRINFSIEV